MRDSWRACARSLRTHTQMAAVHPTAALRGMSDSSLCIMLGAPPWLTLPRVLARPSLRRKRRRKRSTHHYVSCLVLLHGLRFLGCWRDPAPHIGSVKSEVRLLQDIRLLGRWLDRR